LAYFGDDGDAEFGDVFHLVLGDGAESIRKPGWISLP
jgi:hypothetical protein